MLTAFDTVSKVQAQLQVGQDHDATHACRLPKAEITASNLRASSIFCETALQRKFYDRLQLWPMESVKELGKFNWNANLENISRIQLIRHPSIISTKPICQGTNSTSSHIPCAWQGLPGHHSTIQEYWLSSTFSSDYRIELECKGNIISLISSVATQISAGKGKPTFFCVKGRIC